MVRIGIDGQGLLPDAGAGRALGELVHDTESGIDHVEVGDQVVGAYARQGCRSATLIPAGLVPERAIELTAQPAALLRNDRPGEVA